MSEFHLSRRALANIVAALQHWQREDAQDRAESPVFAIGDARPYSDWELAELCEVLIPQPCWIYAVDREPAGPYILVREAHSPRVREVYCGRLYRWQPESRAADLCVKRYSSPGRAHNALGRLITNGGTPK